MFPSTAYLFLVLKDFLFLHKTVIDMIHFSLLLQLSNLQVEIPKCQGLSTDYFFFLFSLNIKPVGGLGKAGAEMMESVRLRYKKLYCILADIGVSYGIMD